jgi:dCTP deaminase
MSMLSSTTITRLLDSGVLTITPLSAGAIQPASIEMHLHRDVVRDVGLPTEHRDERVGSTIVLKPREFALARTTECVGIPAHLVARVEGKSSWARRGLLVHITAGFIDPGFYGTITLELCNLAAKPLELPVGCAIAQLSILELDTPPLVPYGDESLGSHYQHQIATTTAPNIAER